jgi:putative peptidoglycan lipid II flippase
MGSQAIISFLLTVIAATCGFARELVTAAVYATSADADAFALMLVYVEGIATFMSYGIASQILVPLLVRFDAEAGVESGHRADVLSALFVWVAAIGAPLAVLGWWWPDSVMTVMAPLFSPEQRAALRPLAVAAVPTFMLLAAAGVASGALRARSNFYTPIIGRALFSLVTGLVIFVLGARWSTRAAAAGLVAGAFAQFVVQWWRLRRTGWRWVSPRLLQGGLGSLLTAAWPVLMALFLTNILLFAVQRALASDLPTGTFATTNYAQRLLSVVSLLTLSVSTVAATDLARRFREGGIKAVSQRTLSYLETLTVLLAPAALALMALSRWLVELAFHRGSYSAAAAAETADILWVFAFALLPGGICLVLQLLFTSSGRPMLVLVVTVPLVITVWLLTITLKEVLDYRILAGSFVGGMVAMALVSVAAAGWLDGGLMIRQYGGYFLRIGARLLIAIAAVSVAAAALRGRSATLDWIAGRSAPLEAVLAATGFLLVFGLMSWIARDAGYETLARAITTTLGLARRGGVHRSASH